MIDIADRLHNAPPILQRAVVIGVLFLLFLLIAIPSWQAMNHIIGLLSSIADKREQIGRLEAVRSMKTGIIESLSSMEITSGSETLFFEGESEAVIRSSLQGRIAKIATDHNVTLISAGNVPSTDEAGIHYIGLRVDLTGPMAAVHATILAMEGLQPMVSIREASIRATSGSNLAANMAPEIVAQIRLYGAVRTQPPRPADAGAIP